MAPCFSFPVLEKKEICKHLSDLGAPKLSIDNLISPSPDAIHPVYDFLSSCLSVYECREESLQPGFEAVQMLGDYPELHLESYGLLQSLSRLRKFMAAAGAQDFSVPNDLYRPESQRTIMFLSAAINYIMHSQSKLAFIVQLCEVRDEAIAKLEEMNEEKLKKESEIALIEQERAAEHPQVEALELETKELHNKIQALNKKQQGLQRDINNLKQEDLSILDEISNLDFEIMQKQQEGARIRSQLVENPQETQKMLQEKNSALVKEEALARNAAERCETLKAKVEVVTKAEKKLLKLQSLLQALEEQNDARNTADKVVKERKARLKAIEKEEWSLDAKLEELTWGVCRLEDQSEKLSKQCNDASKELQALNARQEQQRIDHESRSYALNEQEDQIEALERKNADILADKESKISRLLAAANKLMESDLAKKNYEECFAKVSAAIDETRSLCHFINTNGREKVEKLREQLNELDLEKRARKNKQVERRVLQDSVSSLNSRTKDLQNGISGLLDVQQRQKQLISTELAEIAQSLEEKKRRHALMLDGLQWYEKNLGFRVKPTKNNGLWIILTKVVPTDLYREFSFSIRHDKQRNVYTLLECNPDVAASSRELVDELNRTNDLKKFIFDMRKLFLADSCK